MPLTADDFNQFTWRWIGPMTFSGRMTGFAVPRGPEPDLLRADGVSGGLWKTEDGGIHFEPIFDKDGTLSMGWLAIAPSNQNILYLGTGEPMHARSSTHGNGMWKSTDAGKTWTKIGLEKSYFIPKVEVDAKNPDIVYVAAEGKLYDNEMDCERGLYKSTDGGKTWTNTRPDEGPRRRRLRDRPAQLGRRHRGVVQDVPPRLDLHRPPAGQRALQEHGRRQDVEEADGGPAAGRGPRAHRPRHLREEPEASSTRASTRK